jgi:prepilin-type N-terminal cleavage/methylation domain-containing protein
MKAFRRQAFTLIELLTVIAIIALLVGLLLPAIAKVRETANMTKCQNAIKQVNLASINYSTNKSALPPGFGTVGTVNGTIHFFLLPYLDQITIYNNATVAGVSDPVNASQLNVAIPFLQCPTDGGFTNGIIVDARTPATSTGLASTSYVANAAVYQSGFSNLTNSMPRGAANTVTWAEQYKNCSGTIAGTAYAQYPAWGWTTGGAGGINNLDLPLFNVNGAGLINSSVAPAAAITQVSPPGGAVTGNALATPALTPGFFLAPGLGNCTMGALNSAHPNGMVTGLGDGSVRNVNSSISPLTWAAVGNPNDVITNSVGW